MTAPSLLDELEGVVRLAEKATPGPFVVDDYGDVTANGEDIARIASGGYEAEHDAKLFASAVNFIRARHTEIAGMAKRLEAAERDARRYRYLRRPQAWKESYIHRLGGISAIFVSDGHRGNATDTEALDVAIDAATQEGEG